MWEEYLALKNVEVDISRLNLQRTRILNAFKGNIEPNWIVNHDADFYFILARRLYRQIEIEGKKNSKIANIKGRYKDLFKKLKIRDSFEHNADLSLKTDPIKISRLLIVNWTKTGLSVKVQSGIYVWDFGSDHRLFTNAFKEYIQLMSK